MFLSWSGLALSQSLPIAGIAHVGYRVSDLAKTSAYYTGVLGLPRSGDAPGGGVYFQVNESQYVEFAPGLKPEDDTRLTHIAIETTDLAALRRILRSRGVAVPAGSGEFSLRAPEGTRLDFVPSKRAPLIASVRMSDHLQHTGVIVRRDQVDAAMRFYHDTLGFAEFWRYEPTPGDLRLIKLLVTGSRRDIIELMIYSGEPPNRKSIGSMQHINFEVADIHAAHRFIRAHGAPVPAKFHPVVNAEDIWAFNLLDPDGTRIEVQDLTKIPMAGIADETFHGRRAWVLSNGWMRVSVLAGGGHIAEVRLISDDPKKSVNPMRVPHYPTIEPFEYDPARHDAVYGNDPSRWLMSGYMGHLLCFPSYGPPSEDEARAGLGSHGEAPIVEWKKMRVSTNTDGVTLWYGADLPKTQYRVERAVHLARGTRSVRVEEWVENLADFDRPMNWMEHATFGQPFAEPGKTVLDASVKAGDLRADQRAFDATPHSGLYRPMRFDPARGEQFFTMFHRDFRVLIGYVFPSEGNVWLADWQENRRAATLPWNGEVVARGMEFGSSPYAEGLRKSVERGTYEGAPAYRWIGAKQRLRAEFTIVLSEIPAGFEGVRDLRTEYGAPILVPR